jgi:hypothetical protein
MSLRRNAALGLVMMLVTLGASAARPLPVDDLVALSASMTPEVLLRLAERRGLDRALGADDRAALLDAGAAPELIERLALLAEPGVEVDGVAYAVVDGVIRVRAEGTEPAGTSTRASGFGEPPPDAATWDDSSTTEKVALAEQAPLSSESAGDAGWSNPYPVGAYGATVGAVFIPARFGGTPSAFGRTIVSTWSGTDGACCYPAPGGPWAVVAPGGPIISSGVRPDARPDGFIPLRTSRGTLWVPN